MRSPTLRSAAFTAVALAAASLFVACGTETAGTSTAVADGSPAAAATAADAGDVAFAQMMIPHHQQAVEMADLALDKAESPEVVALAEQIQGAQQPEIDDMTAWLQDWGAPVPSPDAAVDHSGHDMGSMSGGTGMMTEQQMDDLATASGADFDLMWLDMMIVHHEGAIVMSRQVLETTSDPRVEQMAQAIIDGQTAEIATMQQLMDA
jgi:uncharacterized protein (DUF305 family)